ncbi:MAG: purine-nucleoside phosphorylase [Ruminococcaceae bacterium]|nr:purine-nucleoside phosphorylase [Oscillospiraceae bacterium]
MNYPTPHIKATPQQFGKTVLMPGDPNRSRFIAENFLKDAVLVNNVRGVQGYTGLYKDTPVSVMASGMGMPSIGIYSHELFNAFDVDNIIRVGSAGSIQKDVKVMDVIIGMGACTDSNFGMQFRLPGTFAPIADYGLLSKCVEKAKELNMDNYHVGNVLSSDLFYEDNLNLPGYMQSVELWGKMGVLAFEMESAALYMNAVRYGKHALGIFTVSNHILTGEDLTPEQRETTFTDMITLALETAV